MASSRWFHTIKPCPAPRSGLASGLFPSCEAYWQFLPSWAKPAPDRVVEILAVQYPASEDRFMDTPAATMTELVTGLAEASNELFAVAVSFLGIDMGPSVVYELPLRLHGENGWCAGRPFMSGPGEPSREQKLQLTVADDQELIVALAHIGGTEPEVILDPRCGSSCFPMRADSCPWTPPLADTTRHEAG